MKRVLLASLCVLFISGIVSADIVQGIDIDFVTIGNPGNAGDTRTGTDADGQPLANPYGSGAVDYTYQLGKYEVTNSQWDAFVSAAGAPTGNLGDAYDVNAYWTGTNVPANMVSWYEAAQFCNYLTTGDKSLGAYQFSGNNTNPGDFLGIDRDSAISTYGMVYVIPTEDEWYKAAYYTGSGYSTYANGTDTAPIAGVDTNYINVINQPWDFGDGTQELNGTFDMMGNVYEWNETLVGSDRVIRGGSCRGSLDYGLRSSFQTGHIPPVGEGSLVGFRVASVPEPCSLVLLGLGGLLIRRRKA